MGARILLNVFAAALLAGGAAAQAAEIYVITNAAVRELGADDIRDVYTGERQVAGAVKLVPIDNAALQAEFVQKVLGIDVQKYGTIWTKKSFRDGLNAPHVKGNDAEVAAIVRRTPGAIGYVGSAPPGVTVLKKY